MRGEFYRVFRPSRDDPRRSRVFVIVSRPAFIQSSSSSVICAPVYSSYHGLESQVLIGIDRRSQAAEFHPLRRAYQPTQIRSDQLCWQHATSQDISIKSRSSCCPRPGLMMLYSPRLCGLAVVVLQEPTESLSALDRLFTTWLDLGGGK
jgi:hypothetical protein